MANIILELNDEEAGILYRALVEQFKEWVFSRLGDNTPTPNEENDRMLRVAEKLAERIEWSIREIPKQQ